MTIDHTHPAADLDPGPQDEDAPEPADTIDLSNEATALLEANGHLRAIARIRRERAIHETVFRAEIERITAVYRRKADQLKAQEAWHTTPVEQLHAALLARDDRRRTVVLPHGTLKSRSAKKHRFDVVDDEAFIAWAEDNAADLLRRTPKPDMSAIASSDDVTTVPCTDGGLLVLAAATGEVIPGLVAYMPATTFSIITEVDA